MRRTEEPRPLPILLAAAILIHAAAGCAHGATSEREKADAAYALRVGYIGTVSGGPAGPEGWAYAKGTLAKDLSAVGVREVRFFHFPNGPDLNEAMGAGALDVGILGDTPALLGKASGLPTRLVNQSVVGMDVWLVGRKGGPRVVRELDGQTVATSQGSYMSRYLLGTLESNGLSKSVRVLHLLPPDAQAALERGDIAAYAAPINTGPLLVAKGYPLLDRAADHPDLEGTSVTVALESFAVSHPAFVGLWNAIRERAVRDLENRADEYYRFHAAQAGFPVDIVAASYPLSVFHPEPFSPEGLALLRGAQGFLRHEAISPADVSVDDWIIGPAVTGNAP